MRFLFVDRIVEMNPRSWVRGIKHVTRDDPYLTVDDQGKTCFIPSLVGETLGQLAAWNVMQEYDFNLRPVAGMVACARVVRPVYVGETILLESHIDELDDKSVQYHSQAYVGDELVFSLESAVGPLLPMTDFISRDEIQRQFAEIYKPGDWSSIRAESPNPKTQLLPSGTAAVAAPMRFDRILASEPGVSLVAEKRVTRAAPYFPDHFPNKPVLPLTVLLECKAHLAQEFVARASFDKAYRIHEFRRVKMNDFVQPGDVVVSYLKVKQQTEEELILSYRTEVEGKRVCVVDIVLVS